MVTVAGLNLTSDLMFKFSMLLMPFIAVSKSVIATSSAPFFSTVRFSVSLPPLASRVSRDDRVDVFAPPPA